MSKYFAVKVEPNIKSYFKSGNYSYANPEVKAANIRLVQNINSKYGSIIEYWGDIFEIPKGVLIAFIATESGGTMAKPNAYKATGLMQVTPIAASTVFDWKKEVSTPLPTEVIAEINKKLPSLLTGKFSDSKLLQLLQNDASFNIMMGTLILRWNLQRFSSILTGGQLNKAMVAYNAGAYTRALVVGKSTANKIPIDSNLLSKNPKVPAESRAYLVKMLGIDGFLNLIYKDKVI
jgi:hypothetical protein